MLKYPKIQQNIWWGKGSLLWGQCYDFFSFAPLNPRQKVRICTLQTSFLTKINIQPLIILGTQRGKFVFWSGYWARWKKILLWSKNQWVSINAKSIIPLSSYQMMKLHTSRLDPISLQSDTRSKPCYVFYCHFYCKLQTTSFQMRFLTQTLIWTSKLGLDKQEFLSILTKGIRETFEIGFRVHFCSLGSFP